MHQLLAEQYVASIKRRASQGDCPTEAPLSVEALEDLALTLDALSSIPAQGADAHVNIGLDGSVRWPNGDPVSIVAPSQPAAVGVTDEMVEAATLAIMPWLNWKPSAPETIARAALEAALRSTP